MEEYSTKDAGTVELVEQLRVVQEEILSVIAEIDEIHLQTIPNIRNEYTVRIGCWETKLLEAEIACRRAKRKLALVQAQTNAGALPDPESIDAALEEEFAAWKAQLEETLRSQRQTLLQIASSHILSASETKRIKSLYRTLCKRFHPDLNPDRSDEKKELFASTQAAYKNGDLDVLQALELSTRDMEKEENLDAYTPDELATMIELAQIELGLVQGKRDALLADPIFDIARKLESPEWLASTVAGLKASIAEYDIARREYEARTAELLGTEGR